jgi:hypothetical protein
VQETHLLAFKKSFIEAKSSSLRMDISRALSHFTYKLGLLNSNKCVSCTYAKVIQAFEVKKSEHLVFWSGDYQTNLISDNGTGEKLELIIDKYIQVKHNTVAGIDFKVDGKVILGERLKNHS